MAAAANVYTSMKITNVQSLTNNETNKGNKCADTLMTGFESASLQTRKLEGKQ